MAGHGEPNEGITADGRYVQLGNTQDDLTDQIICGMDKNGDIIRCAEIQPVEFLESNWYEPFDFDEALFANYGKDWWLGVLYRPARRGLLGSTARSNATEAGDAIYKAYEFLWSNKRTAYLMLRAMFRIGLGLDEHEAEIESCLSGNPEQLARFQELNTIIDHQMATVQSTAARRLAGGVFVGFALRRIRIPRKLLQGRSAPVRYGTLVGEFGAKMTINFALAGWGAMMRTYINMTKIRETRTQYATSWQAGREPSAMELLSAVLLGDRRALSLTSEEIRDLNSIVQACDNLPPDLEAELQAFSMLLDVFLTFYLDRQ